MKKFICIIFLYFLSQISFAQNVTLQFIDSIKESAIQVSSQYGIPTSIIISQAIIESSSGRSLLAQHARNYFGLKCSNNWNGKYFLKKDDKPRDCFRKYESFNECLIDYVNILTTRDRYQFLFKYSQSDYKSWAYGLKKAGYATNPDYPALLLNCIQKYNLHLLDLKD